MSEREGSYLLLSATFLLFGKNPLKEMGQFHAVIEKNPKDSVSVLVCFYMRVFHERHTHTAQDQSLGTSIYSRNQSSHITAQLAIELRVGHNCLI